MSTQFELRGEALVLRRFDYGETSQVGHLLTPDQGRVAVLAKGIKKPNASLKGPMDLFQRAVVTIRRGRGAELSLLTRYEPITGHRGLREGLERIYGAFYLSEIGRELGREDHADPGLFQLLSWSLEALERANPAQTASVVLVAELGLLANAGFELATRSCAHCGAGVPPGKARFEPAAGGVVCTHCRDREAVARELSGGARAALSALEAADAANLPRLRPSTAQIQELRDLMHVIWLNILERPLKSAVFVRDRSFGFLRAARVARR